MMIGPITIIIDDAREFVTRNPSEPLVGLSHLLNKETRPEVAPTSRSTRNCVDRE